MIHQPNKDITTTPPKGNDFYALLGTVNFLERHNSVIVCNNKAELAYVIAWCDGQGKHVADYMRTKYKFPYCLSVAGDIVGWIDRMDRAVYYIDFITFVKAVS